MMRAIIFYLPWLISVITLASMIMIGNKHRNAWSISLANQVLWLVWVLADQAWGLLPLNLCLWAIYIRNHLRWRREWKAQGR